jgi:hypothetical protein
MIFPKTGVYFSGSCSYRSEKAIEAILFGRFAQPILVFWLPIGFKATNFMTPA